MNACPICLHEYDGTPCGCRLHRDPHKAMGQILHALPYQRPQHLPPAVLAKIIRQAVLEDLDAADPVRARRDRLDDIQALYDRTRQDVLDVERARRAGL